MEKVKEQGPQPEEICIYAVDVTRTKEDRVTKQGFGYSTPLSSPRQSTDYVWEGKLHGRSVDVVRSSSSQESIARLAENFAWHYRQRLHDVLKAKGQPSYSISFTVPEHAREENRTRGEKVVVRPLNTREQEEFMRAFQKENHEAREEGEKRK